VNESRVQFLSAYAQVADEFYTSRSWIAVWPVAEVNYLWRSQSDKCAQQGLVSLPDRGTFLRDTSPIVCGSLLLPLYTLFEEVGLSMLNTSPHIFSMCHLVNTLRSKQLLIGSWPGLEQTAERFAQGIFVGEAPTEIDAMLTKFQLGAGKSIAYLSASKRHQFKKSTGRNIPAASTSKKWDMRSSIVSLILREYVHGRQSLVATIYRLDAYLAKQNGVERQLVEGGDVLAFLVTLPAALEDIVSKMRLDYITLDAACRVLFEKMDKRMGNVPVGGEDSQQSWGVMTYSSYEIVWDVLLEMQSAEQGPVAAMPLMNVAVKLLKTYIASGGQGISTPYVTA
jgi:hypothetical protein